MNASELLSSFIFFLAVIDPIGSIPVFIAVTNGYDQAEKRHIAIRATIISALILLFFVIAGEWILTATQVSLPSFQVAGGIVLFAFSMTMIFGEGKPEEEKKLVASGKETAVFPLAVPSIASPGAMLAAVLQTENAKFNFTQQVGTTLVILVVLVIALVFMLVATRIEKLIGDSGASIISRVMGLILASMAVESVLSGIKSYFGL